MKVGSRVPRIFRSLHSRRASRAFAAQKCRCAHYNGSLFSPPFPYAFACKIHFASLIRRYASLFLGCRRNRGVSQFAGCARKKLTGQGTYCSQPGGRVSEWTLVFSSEGLQPVALPIALLTDCPVALPVALLVAFSNTERPPTVTLSTSSGCPPTTTARPRSKRTSM
jgi:hypothetical protein